MSPPCMGCYIGQEVLNRIHTGGHVNTRLCRLMLADDLRTLPVKGDRLFAGITEVGHITSAARLPSFQRHIGPGYVRRGHDAVGTVLRLVSSSGESVAGVGSLRLCEGRRSTL